MKNIILLSLLIFSMYSCSSSKGTSIEPKFENDLISNEKIAIQIADVIWSARFEGLKWYKDLPYTVKLENDKVWYVKSNLPNGYFGKILHIKINKNNGQILKVWIEG